MKWFDKDMIEVWIAGAFLTLCILIITGIIIYNFWG